MSEIDAVLYEYVKSVYVIYTDLFCFQASTALCIFMSTHANSWIKVAARQNIIWIRFGNRRAIRRQRAEAGMALTAIGDCSGSRTWSNYPIHLSGRGQQWSELPYNLQNKKCSLKAERNYTRSAYRLSEIYSKGRHLQHRCAYLRARHFPTA